MRYVSHLRWSPLALALCAMFLPPAAEAQSGKWLGTITQLSGGGSADVTIDPRNEKQSRARISFRSARANTSLAWDIVAGSCRDEGQPIAPQAAFTPAQTQMDGGGTVTANVPRLEPGKKYYLRVYNPKSAPTDASALGCANLSEKPD